MLLDTNCIPCLLNQALRAVRVAKPGIGRHDEKTLLGIVMGILQDDEILDLIPAVTGKRVYDAVNEFLGIDDAFLDVKQKSNEAGRALYPRLVELVERSDFPLETAAKVAISGNLIDSGADLAYDLEEEIHDLRLAIDDFSLLKADLSTGGPVLYLADNAGEIYFDKVFIKQIMAEFPGTSLTVAVRSGPIINDATMVDAIGAGLDRMVPVIESTPTAGVILEQASKTFLEHYRQASVVISKGQGNFESLSEEPPGRNLYFMLKAKCVLMEKIFGVPIGSSILASHKRLRGAT